MGQDAQIPRGTVLVATLVAIVAFVFFEHTAWLVLAFCVLAGYCGRAYVQQSQPEIAQMQMHDMVDHTALHPQSQDTVAQSSGMTEMGSSADTSQRLGAPAQSTSVGTPSERQLDTTTAQMPSDNTSSEQFSEGAIRDMPAPHDKMPDADFTFPDVGALARGSPSPSPALQGRPPAIQPMQPMQHMDPMQVLLRAPLVRLLEVCLLFDRERASVTCHLFAVLMLLCQQSKGSLP